MKKEVSGFFNPKKIAVIGASRHKEKIGNAVFRNLLNSGLEVFPVNPNAEKILRRKSYKEVLDVPYDLDLAVVVVKAALVPGVLEQCGKKGIRNIIVISAGFKEAGNLFLEEEVRRIAEKYEMNLLGPNVLGVISPRSRINASFTGMPKSGKIALISQSGAVGVGLLDKAKKMGIGFSGFVSLGNQACLGFSEFIEYFSEDKSTEVICLYIESLKSGQGRRFLEICKKTKKPIVAIKSGKSLAGQKAARLHTAALATDFRIYSGVFKQAGIIEVENLERIFQVADTITKLNKKRDFRKLKRGFIITNAGGLGVLCSDYCSKAEIKIPDLPLNLKKKIEKILPDVYNKNNPLDLLGGAMADDYEKAIKLLDGENFFDFFIVLLTPQQMTQSYETARVLLNPGIRKPVFACFVGGAKVDKARKLLREKIPVFSEVMDISLVLRKLTC